MNDEYNCNMSYHFARIIVKWSDENLLSSAEVLYERKNIKPLDFYLFSAIINEIYFRNLLFEH